MKTTSKKNCTKILICISGGSGISIPMPRPYSKIREDMLQNVRDGKNNLGQLIESKSFKKFRLDTSGTLIESIYTIAGRKIALLDIRKKLYFEHKKKGILRDDIQTIKRNILVWADHASVLNSGRLLLTGKIIYSTEIFLQMKKWKINLGKVLMYNKS